MIFKNDKVICEFDLKTCRPIVKELDDTICFGHIQQEILDLCLIQPFPGSSTNPPDSPIWLGHSGNSKTPLEAWTDVDILKKAIRNWWYMMCFNEIMLKYNPDNRTPEQLDSYYVRYNDKWGKALLDWNKKAIAMEVLNRFTVAKLAPRVTALSANKVLQIMEESGLNFSCGVYCPMGGFNGIPEGTKKWAKKYNKQIDIEVYDINPVFCKYYGYIQRDVTAQIVKTDKIVVCCPPYGPNDERWKYTLETNAAGLNTYMGFYNWCKVITQYVQSSAGYVFIGPNTDSKNSCGLFSKSGGSYKYYSEYVKGCFE